MTLAIRIHTIMEDFAAQDKWVRRDLKHKSKKRFVSDNRKSVRWLYLNSGTKAGKRDDNAIRSKNLL